MYGWLAALVLGLLAAAGGLWADQRLDGEEAARVLAEAQRDGLIAAVEAQNAKIARWRTEAEQQAARVAAAQAQAERVREAADARVAAVLSAPVPADCPDAVRWAAERAREFARHWEAGR